MLQISGSVPASGNSGFREGQLEGTCGVFQGYTDNGDVKIRLTNDSIMEVPTIYIGGEKPSNHGQRVIVIEDANHFGEEYTTMFPHNPGVWVLTGLRGKLKGKDLLHISTDNLVRYF